MSFVFTCFKYLKRLLFVFFVLIVLTIWFATTHSGNTFIFSVLQKIEPRLTLTLTDGSVLDSPVYEKIRWQDQDTLIELNEVSYVFNWACLFDELCLDSLVVGSATINIPESAAEDEVEEENTEPFKLTFPLPVHIKQLDINKTKVNVAGINIDLNHIILKADGVDNDLTLNSTINGLIVTLADSEITDSTTTTSVDNTLDNNQALLERFPAILNDDSLPEVILPFNLITEKLAITDFKLIQNGQNIVVVNQLDTQFSYIGSAITVDQLTVNIPEANADLTGKIDLSKRYPMDLNVIMDIKEVKELEPSTLLSGQKITLKSKGDLGNLNSTITLANLIEGKIDNTIDLYTDNLPHELTVEWQKFNWPLTGKPDISATAGKLHSEGDLTNYKLSLVSQYALPDLPQGSIDLQSTGNLQSLTLSQLLVNTLQGNVLLKGKLSWVDNLTWLGDLNINNLNFKELSADYPAKLNGHVKQSVTVALNEKSKTPWSFDLPTIDLNGSFLSRPLTIKGKIKGDANNGFDVNNLTVLNGENTVYVNGKVADKSNLVLDLNLQNLSNIIIAAKGQIQGKVNVTGSLDKIKVNSALNANNLSYLDNSVAQLSLNGQATLTDIPVLDLTLSANNIIANNQKIKSLTAIVAHNEVTNKRVSHNINLNLDSNLVSSDLAILFTQERNTWQAKLNEGIIKTSQAWLLLEKPFVASMEKQTLSLTDHCWLISDKVKTENGHLCVNTFNAGDNGDIKIAINDFIMSALTPFIPETLTLEGAINSRVNVSWKKSQKPTINLLVRGKEIALNIQTDAKQNKFTRYPVEQLLLDVNTMEDNADFSFKAKSDGLINANLNGKITPYQESPGIEAKLDLLIPNFDAFSALIPQVDELAGNLQADINIGGSINNPELKGQVLIADTSVKAPDSPVQVTDLNTEVNIDNNTAQITGYFFTNSKKSTKDKNKSFVDTLVSIKDTAISTVNIPQRIANMRKVPKTEAESNGRVDITGVLDWAEQFKASIKLNAQQMRIDDYGMLELYVSPNIDIIYDKNLSIEGTVHVDKGNITVKELPAGAVSVSKDVIIVDAKNQETSADLPVKMNIKVSLGERLRLKALGLDSYIHGNLLVKKRLTKELTVNGEITFSQGSYRALSQQLVLQNSRIVFQGPPSTPYLNIEAIRDPNNIEDNVTAGVRVTGTPDQLQIKIFSDTAMSQQNALSYITRGHSIDSDSGNNSQLTSILIDLGAGQTDGTLNNIGETVGINNLSLSSSGQGTEQSVGLKGTIAPGVEVSYGVGVFDSFTIFAIRYELFKRFYIEASSGLSQAVDAYYEWDWD
jgi:translocation and assembly module TamB